MRNKHMLFAITAFFSALAQADEPIILDKLFVTGSLTPISASK